MSQDGELHLVLQDVSIRGCGLGDTNGEADVQGMSELDDIDGEDADGERVDGE